MGELADSYAECEAITRSQAANFYYGIRLLSPERRRALCAAYAFARRVDDIGDGTLPAAEKLRLLEGTDAALSAMHSPGAPGRDPVLIALADADERFQLPGGALAELIEGVRMDVLGTRYETFEELVGYCRRVAGAIGRVCLAIFDSRELSRDSPTALAHADDLGVALQLTNILRDVREDAENGRVYIPMEDLRRFGLSGATAAAGHPELAEMAARLAGLARERPQLRTREGGGDVEGQEKSYSGFKSSAGMTALACGDVAFGDVGAGCRTIGDGRGIWFGRSRRICVGVTMVRFSAASVARVCASCASRSCWRVSAALSNCLVAASSVSSWERSRRSARQAKIAERASTRTVASSTRRIQ